MGIVRTFLLAWLVVPLALWAQPVAEIVSIKGKGERSESPVSGWRPAQVRQKLDAGTWLRTLQDSRMALLLADQTNATVDANSTWQLKAAEGAAPRRSIVDFQKGKGRFETKTPGRSFSVTTPAGLAAIRGTEWLVEVDDDGRSAFTVVEGEIELSNALGTLSVGAHEQGILERGRAPYKRRVQNARERVQWVSSFTIDPSMYPELRAGGAMASRYAAVLEAFGAGEVGRARTLLASGIGRDEAPASYFLLADIAIYRGNAREAVEWLLKAGVRFPEEPRTPGLLARAYLFADEAALAREAAANARARFPDTLESQLYAGEAARLDGDARLARAALRRAAQIAPDDWRAWHALGQLHSERMDPRRARRALDRAEQLSPRNAAVLGERGLLEANAFDLPLARRKLDDALAAQPDDFAGWTGLGVARLKSGDVEGALEALLKATLIEPGYARAHVYLAVVYWRQGRVDDALARLKTASVHDPNDPLPYQLASMIESDLMRPGDAVDSARQAMARLRFAKSLDAIANNLRGSANLGTPLAQLGLEAWALKNAQDSFDPLWAGSHLFLADRLDGKFVANSELMQGFLADPLAFGASNRFQPLVTGPGHYGTLAWRGARSSDVSLTEPLANLNGLIAEGRFAYFVEGARLKLWADDTSDRASSVTAALGLRPRDDLGFFFYYNRLVPESIAGTEGAGLVAFQRIDGTATRADAGLLYRPGPDTQLWVKGGHGSEDSRLAKREVSVAAPVYLDSDFSTDPRRRDAGARGLHRFADGTEVSITVEGARSRSIDFLERDAFFPPNNLANRVRESVRQDIRDTSKGVEIAARTSAARALVGEAQLDYTRYDKSNDIVVRRDYAGQLTSLDDDHERGGWSPRGGFAWRAMPTATLRAAYQRWLRPASIGSLKASSTAGIVLDDRFVLPGGRLERLRVQAEWQATPRVLVTAFADRQEIDNLFSSLIGVLNNRPDATNLERLRNRSFTALASLESLEGFPSAARGDLTERGFTVNALATQRISVFAEGTWATSENTGAFFPGKLFPFLPRRRLALGATCFPARNWSLAAKAIHRTERFADEANAMRLAPEWSGALQGYWETSDKRWSVEVIVASIGAKSADESVGVALNYRF